MKIGRVNGWLQFIRHGYGTQISKQEYDLRQSIQLTRTVEYLGHFDNDKRSGQKCIQIEKLEYEDFRGDPYEVTTIYEGDFKDDTFNGQGILYKSVYTKNPLLWLSFAIQNNRFYFSSPVFRKMSSPADIHRPIEKYDTFVGSNVDNPLLVRTKDECQMYCGLFWAEQWTNPYRHIWTEMQPDSSYYRGFVRNGKKNGVGTEMCGNNNKYFGEFKDDYRHGRGMFEQGFGDRYFG